MVLNSYKNIQEKYYAFILKLIIIVDNTFPKPFVKPPTSSLYLKPKTELQ